MLQVAVVGKGGETNSDPQRLQGGSRTFRGRGPWACGTFWKHKVCLASHQWLDGKAYEADPELGIVRQEREPRGLETQERWELQFTQSKQVRMEWTDGAMRLLVRGGTDVARCRVALSRVTSMGTTDCGIEKPSLFDHCKPPSDNCFEGDISVPNCTMRGKLNDSKERDGVQGPLMRASQKPRDGKRKSSYLTFVSVEKERQWVFKAISQNYCVSIIHTWAVLCTPKRQNAQE